MTERKSDPPQDEDPLVELARIVSGRSSFGGETAAPSAEPKPAEPSTPEPSIDLESELLNELQASFAALSEPSDDAETPDLEPDPEPSPPPPVIPEPPRRAETPRAAPPERSEPVPPARPQRPAVPPPEAPVSRATPTERPRPPARTAPPARSEPPVPPTRSDPPPPPASLTDPSLDEPLALPRFLSEPSAPAEPEEATDSRRPQGGPADQAEPNPPVPAAPRRPRNGIEGKSDRPALRYKSRSASERREASEPREPAAPALPPFPEDDDEAPRTRRGLSRFAPQRAAAQVPLEREGTPRPPRRAAPPPPPVRDEPPATPAPPPTDFDAGFSLDDLAGEEFAPGEELPPFPDDELEGNRRGHGGRLLIVIGAILLIGIAGAGAAYFMGGDAGVSGPPPIITADNSPDKVAPEAPEPTDDGQSKLFLDRIDGVEADDTTLVTPEDDPVDEIPAADGANDDNPISRVIIPGGPGFDSSAQGTGGSGEQVVASNGDAGTEEDIGPRKVRTVVVKPDGTIVSSEAVAEGIPMTDGGTEADIGNPLGITPEVPDGRTEMDDVLEGGVEIPVNTDPLNAARPDAIASAGIETPEAPPAPPADDLRETVTPVEPAAPEPPPAPVETPAPVEPAPAPQPAAVASLPQSGSGGVMVQVSAQRSEEAAQTTYRSLQQRYPNILGPFQAAIIRVDLDSGTWYRVRIGPFSGGDATRLCEDLKAAGGDCLVAR